MHGISYSMFFLCGLVGLCTGCSLPGNSANADLWENYDVRHSMPYASERPGAAYPYIDNDQYYIAPSCSIFDAPSCGGD